MRVRAKFKCIEVAKNEQGSRVILNVVTAGSATNEEFFKLTPYGGINMGIINEEAAKEFVPGKEFYVDFIAAEDEDK